MVLINGEFETRGMQFGSTRSGYPLKNGGFSVGALTFQVQDKESPTGDGTVFGEDSLPGSTYAFDMWLIGTEDEEGWRDVSRRLSAFRKLWHGSPSRKTPRAVDTLKLWHGDKPGLVYGRPRNYAEDRTIIRRGAAGISCDFLAVNDLIYEESAGTLDLRLSAASQGGLVAVNGGITAPVTGQGGGTRQGFFDIGGDADTPVIIAFFGPVTNPRFTVIGEWTMCLNESLKADECVLVDSRPWIRSITKTGSVTSSGGTLTRDSVSLRDMVLSTGSYEAVFEGIDATNTALVSLIWHNARFSV